MADQQGTKVLSQNVEPSDQEEDPFFDDDDDIHIPIPADEEVRHCIPAKDFTKKSNHAGLGKICRPCRYMYYSLPARRYCRLHYMYTCLLVPECAK